MTIVENGVISFGKKWNLFTILKTDVMQSKLKGDNEKSPMARGATRDED